MMEKLTINHLAPYLPYGLQIAYSDTDIRELVYLDTSAIHHTFHFKPLLIPLSELKDILYDWLEQDFVPFDCKDFLYTLEIAPIRTPLFICDKIFELHGDLFGLIPAGLALSK